MKPIIETKDLIERNFDGELLDDVANVLWPLDLEIIYEDEKKKQHLFG